MGREIDQVECFGNPLVPFSYRYPQGSQRLLDRLRHGKPRIQLFGRFLEYDLDLAKQRFRFGSPDGLEVMAFEVDLAAREIGEPDHATTDRGLARAALPDQPDRLSGLNGDRHAIDRLDLLAAAGDRKMLGQLYDVEKRDHRTTGK